MNKTIINVSTLTPSQTWKTLGKCLWRLYKEYETPILYAVLFATYTWVFITR